ncbi:CPBP family glutamic-type intramembrane protease [Agromyces endophyticus]|uniref:CPBP family glutamic-type intramembrane protease n=1 Tax=Agromyces sp. H17E-10 TaxID=2932244 RepID=UPI001FCFCAF6|nr:CPBP family glutamic-type intramembrane protease [Agromyces sp. H17E-10]UOQ87897.1 CPBP family glutamic-type intramembrane protease [Agromyces sp. H17E-10]
MADLEHANAWRRFWEQGGWWRSLLVVVVYYALYAGFSFVVVSPIAEAVGDDPVAVLWVDYVLPIGFGGLLLVLFAWSLGWFGQLFGRQPIRGRWWMWIGLAVPLLFAVLHFASIDYAKAGFAVVISWLVVGLCIGFAEEVLTRGFVVNLMRKAGHHEFAVAAVSAALFAALHLGNLLTGQDLLSTLFQVPYTFGFGVCMYLTLRVTGRLIWPILLHAATDPSTFMTVSYPVDGALPHLAGLGNIVVTITGIVLLIFIRGRVEQPAVEGLVPARTPA